MTAVTPTPEELAAPEREVITASHWGIVRVKTENGRIAGIRPWEGDAAPSPLIGPLAEHPYSDVRIRHPMVRKSYLDAVEKGLAPESTAALRGVDPYVQVSWDRALDLTAKAIQTVYDKYGPSAVWGRSYGWKSAGNVNASIGLLQRLLNLKGGWVQTFNSYSTAAIGTILPYVCGQKDPKSTAWPQVLEHSERIVFWGCDPLVTNDIDWLTTLHQSTPIFSELKDHPRIRVIAVNPVRPDTTKAAGARWLAPLPGTDCAMMLGMMHALYTRGLADTAFLDKYCAGRAELEDYLFGRKDGTEKTPEWAAKQCGLPAETIVDLALELQSHRTMIMFGWGPQRARYGEEPAWMAWALACVIGQIGLPGGGIGSNYHYSSGGSPGSGAPFVNYVPTRLDPVEPPKHPWQGSRFLPVASIADALLNPGKTIECNGQTLTYPELKLVFWAGGNPFAHHPNANRLAEAFKRPDAVIVSDTVWSATARRADIVLPAATAFEHPDITPIGTYTNDGIAAMQQVIAPVGEARSDWAIFSALAERLGVGLQFTEGLDEEGWIRRLYEDNRRQMTARGVTMPTLDEFWQAGVYLYPENEAEKRFVAWADFRADPEAHPLKTESGRIQLFSPRIASYGYDDCPGWPVYIAPFIDAGDGLDADGDVLRLVSPKTGRRLHSQLDHVSGRKANVSGREPCGISTEDAAKRGIETGDLVLLSNGRGSLIAGAVVTPDVRPGVLLLRHGGWFDPQKVADQGNVDVHGNANVLTPDIPASKLSHGNISSTALVTVEKYTGPVPDVSVFSPPASVS